MLCVRVFRTRMVLWSGMGSRWGCWPLRQVCDDAFPLPFAVDSSWSLHVPSLFLVGVPACLQFTREPTIHSLRKFHVSLMISDSSVECTVPVYLTPPLHSYTHVEDSVVAEWVMSDHLFMFVPPLPGERLMSKPSSSSHGNAIFQP